MAGRRRPTPPRSRPAEPLARFVPPLHRVAWRPCYRVIPSRFPPVDLFERVADPADLEAVFAIEALTNVRIREQVGELALVDPADRVTGPGATWIMAPFTHVAGPGGRFSTATFGAWYAAHTLHTAVAETKYHRARFLAATSEPPIELDMRVLQANVAAELHDVRGLADVYPAIYDPDDYTASRELAVRLRAEGSWGLVFDSVRDPEGECVAVLRPPAISACKQSRHLVYVWDGTRIEAVYEKRLFRA